jgi:hypothetical protein
MPQDEKEQKNKLITLVRKACERDKELREKYGIGDKFRFVRDRLTALLEQLEKHVEAVAQKEKKSEATPTQDHELLVYVYLYNSQGAAIQTWVNMLSPKLFYEYSVNRPIYTEKVQIESLIRGKSNPVQHGYLSVAINPKDLVQSENPTKDVNGNPIAKVKEGGLRFERFLTLTHGENNYTLSEQGMLVKKL